ncbi:MAG: hypothetical protein ACKVXR_04740 [Planctomycetota bacterium]
MKTLFDRRTCPEWLSRDSDFSVFIDTFCFYDDVHGQISVNQLERDIIDTPEFQRLFRVSQLGCVDLVFQTANHSRAVHSIGACAVAKQLIDLLNHNTERTVRSRRARSPQTPQVAVQESGARVAETQHHPQRISFGSSILVSAGALLHDISHGPFSHDIEQKAHRLFPKEGPEQRVRSAFGTYPKHDDLERNPALYRMFFQAETSVLARVLTAYSPVFWKLLKHEIEQSGNTMERSFVTLAEKHWPNVRDSILANLLFHLLVYEDAEDARFHSISVGTPSGNNESWGLGPLSAREQLHQAWYQPFRHDVIGNTVSADLLDYLLRDMHRLGIDRKVDYFFLNMYVLVPWAEDGENSLDAATFMGVDESKYRCAIDVTDYKRGGIRHDAINDVFRLLDLRLEIHEKAVFHRVSQAATAMLSRAVFLLPKEARVLDALYGWNGPSLPLCGGEDWYLATLLGDGRTTPSNRLADKLAERRVYRPLMVIPGDRVEHLLVGFDTKDPEMRLRALAAIMDSSFYAPFVTLMSWCVEKLLQHAFDGLDGARVYLQSFAQQYNSMEEWKTAFPPERIIFWTPPYKQLYKKPEILVRVRGRTAKGEREQTVTLESLRHQPDGGGVGGLASIQASVMAGFADADSKYDRIWKLSVFGSDSLFYSGLLDRIVRQGKYGCGNDDARHVQCVNDAQGLIVETLRTVWWDWLGRGEDLNLNSESTTEVLQILVGNVANPPRAAEQYSSHKIAEVVSGLDVARLVHGQGLVEGDLSIPDGCRDIRFRFDLGGEHVLEKVLARRCDSAIRSEVSKFLKDTGLTPLIQRESEAEEIVGKLVSLRVGGVPLHSLMRRNAAELRDKTQALMPTQWRTLWLQSPGWHDHIKTNSGPGQ